MNTYINEIKNELNKIGGSIDSQLKKYNFFFCVETIIVFCTSSLPLINILFIVIFILFKNTEFLFDYISYEQQNIALNKKRLFSLFTNQNYTTTFLIFLPICNPQSTLSLVAIHVRRRPTCRARHHLEQPLTRRGWLFILVIAPHVSPIHLSHL